MGNGRDERLLRLIEVFRGRPAFLIQTHNNPGRAARIAFGGIVGRSEIRAMLRYLKVHMVPGEKVDYGSFDLIALVDSQPDFRYNPMPADVTPQIVIDHHPPREDDVPEGVEFAVLAAGYGATASILGELMARNRIPVPEEVAPALVYGIKADTQDLGRETSEADIAAYSYLYPLANKRLMSRIESERLPENYFQEFSNAIENAVIYDFVVASDLGEVEIADMVAEMADFLLRLEGARWSSVLGTCGGTLHLSLRAAEEHLRSGEAIAAALAGRGSCGGHASMAGGQVPVEGLSEEAVKDLKEEILTSLLDHLKVKKTLRRSLVRRDEKKAEKPEPEK